MTATRLFAVCALALALPGIAMASAQACRWAGNAPFCSGACLKGETARAAPVGAPAGASCWTGSKLYCCPLYRSAARADMYAVLPNLDLVLLERPGNDSAPPGQARADVKAGRHWAFQHVFAGDDGAIYAVNHANDLLWYRHERRRDGSFGWAFDQGRPVGNGWRVRHVFHGGDGVIYVVDHNGELKWYRHAGRHDGTFRWAYRQGKVVGHGWNMKHVFHGGGGVLYAINDKGELFWNRHDGRDDGSSRWALDRARRVATGWHVKHVFSSGDGIIYAIDANHDLLRYRHEGHADGSARWAVKEGERVGQGWDVRQIFSSAPLTP